MKTTIIQDQDFPCPTCGGEVGHRINCPHGIAFSNVATRPGNIVEIEWQLPVCAPAVAQTILIVHDGTVYAGVFVPATLWTEARVIRYPEDYLPVSLADCDYWAALPSRPYR